MSFAGGSTRSQPSSLTALVFTTLILTTLLTPSTANPTAYDLLESYGFPAGLLPQGVKGFDLDRSTGKFAVHLNGTCSFSVEGGYQLKYQPTIKGHITPNKLQNLEGISVKILLFWVNIVEVVRVGGEVQLSVGIASANFPVDNFEECPQCGCGLDCGGRKQVSDVDVQFISRSNPFLVSS